MRFYVFFILLSSFTSAQYLSRIVGKVYDNLYHNSVSKLLAQQSLASLDDPRILDNLRSAAVFSNGIYTNSIGEATVLSVDSNRRPECILKLVDTELWVVVRGTAGPMDLLRDMSWMFATRYDASFSVPAGVLAHANDLTEVLSKLLKTTYKNSKITRINLTGHSLGGSIATTIFFNLKLRLKLDIPCKVYTFGAPYCVAWEPKTTASRDLNSLEPHVFNVIYQLDVIPRILAAKQLPKYLFLSTLYDNTFMRPKNYAAFGFYFSTSKSGATEFVHSVDSFMSLFPSNELDFLYSIVNDHSMTRLLAALVNNKNKR